MDKSILLQGLVIFLIGTLSLLPLYYFDKQPKEMVDVLCYDRYGNMLQEIGCTEERYVNQNYEYFEFPFLLFYLLFSPMGIIIIIIGCVMPKEKK